MATEIHPLPKVLQKHTVGEVSDVTAKGLTKRRRTKGKRQSGREVLSDVNRVKALQLKIAGHSYREIGAQLGVSHVAAMNYVDSIIARGEAITGDLLTQFRAIESERLEAIVNRWLPIATSENLRVEDEMPGRDGEPRTISIPAYEAGTKAAAIVIKAGESLRTLFGLDAPQKKEITGANGAPLIPATSPEVETALDAGYKAILRHGRNGNTIASIAG